MARTTDRPVTRTLRDRAARHPLGAFITVALPAGWLLLSLPIVLDLPREPFVLATLLLALVLPAVALTALDGGRGAVRALLRDAVRLPRPLSWGPVAALALPVVVWLAAAPLGAAVPPTPSVLVGFAVGLVTGAIIINIWEEVVWTGFVQRRAMARWGSTRGSVATAVLFAGIHAPLAFDGARTGTDVLVGLAVLLGTGLGLRLLIAHLDTWSGGSLLTVGILHASFNATAGLVEPGHDWVRLAVTVVLGVVVTLATIARHRARTLAY